MWGERGKGEGGAGEREKKGNGEDGRRKEEGIRKLTRRSLIKTIVMSNLSSCGQLMVNCFKLSSSLCCASSSFNTAWLLFR